eukprot:735468-Prymnesium_polylepis.1
MELWLDWTVLAVSLGLILLPTVRCCHMQATTPKLMRFLKRVMPGEASVPPPQSTVRHVPVVPDPV